MTLKYFKRGEFTCRCGCGETVVSSELLSLLDNARGFAKIPFVVNSGYRCAKHPESINNPKSSHIKGLAVDIKCTDSHSRAIIIDALGYVGFKRFGIADSFIHTDIDNEKPNPAIWLY
tara:strand:- start:1463 stop:1816 length:354 start_codon:yes stop_codon:yes gene_type:complete